MNYLKLKWAYVLLFGIDSVYYASNMQIYTSLPIVSLDAPYNFKYGIFVEKQKGLIKKNPKNNN